MLVCVKHTPLLEKQAPYFTYSLSASCISSKLTFLGQNSNCYLGANVVRGATHAHNQDAVMITDIPSLR